MPARIMLLDDDSNNLNAMWRVLRQLEMIDEVERFSDAREALARSGEAHFDLAIADYRMPEMDGAHFFAAFRQLQPHCYRIIVSGHTDVELFKAAINHGQIHRFIEKPYDGFMLAQAVSEGLAQGSLHREIERQRTEIERLRELLRAVAEKSPGLLPADWDAAQPA